MLPLRIGVGRIWHESNSFSTVPASLDHFRECGCLAVGDALLGRPDARDEVAGFLDACRSASPRAETVPLLNAGAPPSGPVTEGAVRYLTRVLRDRLRAAGPLDGILFALHGAMSADGIPDLDGYFLGVVRQECGPDLPVVGSLDCHAVVTRRMAALATALFAYRTHPHTDVVETGCRAAEVLLETLRGRVRPVAELVKIPLIAPPPDGGTSEPPLRDLFSAVAAADGDKNVLGCSLCCSQPWLDVPEQGWSALAVTNADRALARRLAVDLARRAWDARDACRPADMVGPDDAVRAAAAAEGGPVVITDSADTIGAGAPGDTTALLDALLRHRGEVNGLILIHLPDAKAVERLAGCEMGSAVTLDVGGKRDTRFSKPLRLSGTLLCLTDGRIEDVGRFGPTPFIDAGQTACLAVDNVRVVLTGRIVMGPQPSVFRKVGLEPFEARIVALKTGIGFRVTYGAVAKKVIRADCPGAASYNLANYSYPRSGPLYPLSRDVSWDPSRA